MVDPIVAGYLRQWRESLVSYWDCHCSLWLPRCQSALWVTAHREGVVADTQQRYSSIQWQYRNILSEPTQENNEQGGLSWVGFSEIHTIEEALWRRWVMTVWPWLQSGGVVAYDGIWPQTDQLHERLSRFASWGAEPVIAVYPIEVTLPEVQASAWAKAWWQCESEAMSWRKVDAGMVSWQLQWVHGIMRAPVVNNERVVPVSSIQNRVTK